MVVIAAVCECFFSFFRAEAAFTKKGDGYGIFLDSHSG